MRLAELGFIILAATYSASSYAQNPDDALKVYAVNVVRDHPQSKEPFVSSGIYLGQGMVITVAHVIGPNLRVRIAGRDLRVNIIKQGSSDTTDLALLSLDELNLPVSLLLRRIPLCKEPPKAGDNVVVVVPSGTRRSRIISRGGINAFIGDVSTIGDSGSGIFDAQKRCLLGIMNEKISDFYYLMKNGSVVRDLARGSIDTAKHFVPASEIADFIPPELRF